MKPSTIYYNSTEILRGVKAKQDIGSSHHLSPSQVGGKDDKDGVSESVDVATVVALEDRMKARFIQ